MGLKMTQSGFDFEFDQGIGAFSQDILKIEISGPDVKLPDTPRCN